jgi:hypothetical protein
MHKTVLIQANFAFVSILCIHTVVETQKLLPVGMVEEVSEFCFSSLCIPIFLNLIITFSFTPQINFVLFRDFEKVFRLAQSINNFVFVLTLQRFA